MKVIRYHMEDGVFTGLLVAEGRKFLKVVLMDSAGIKLRKVPLAEQRYMKDLPDYPVQRAQEKFRDAARKFNTETLSQPLREALDIH